MLARFFLCMIGDTFHIFVLTLGYSLTSFIHGWPAAETQWVQVHAVRNCFAPEEIFLLWIIWSSFLLVVFQNHSIDFFFKAVHINAPRDGTWYPCHNLIRATASLRLDALIWEREKCTLSYSLTIYSATSKSIWTQGLKIYALGYLLLFHNISLCIKSKYAFSYQAISYFSCSFHFLVT